MRTRVPYTAATPTSTTVYTLYDNSTAAMAQPTDFDVRELRSVHLALENSHACTLKAYRQLDDGTFSQCLPDDVLAASTANTPTVRHYDVSAFRGFKLTVTNGGTTQTTWKVDLTLDTEPVNTISASALPTGAATAAKQVAAIEVARTAHLASAALPAAGAFTSQTAYTVPTGVSEVTFECSYTRGAAGGYAIGRVQFGDGTGTYLQTCIDDTSGVVTGPVARVSEYIWERRFGTPADASALTFAVTVQIPRGVTTVALLMAEVGQTATPGTASAFIVAGGGR